MEVLVAGLVAAAVAVAVGLVLRPRTAAGPVDGPGRPVRAAGAPDTRAAAVAPAPEPAAASAGAPGVVAAPEPEAATAPAGGDELRARRSELVRLEERLLAREQSLELRAQELSDRERSLEDRRRNLDNTQETLKEARRNQLRELEQIAHLSPGQARQILLRELEDEVRHDSARLIRQVEEETKRDADRLARNILSTVMQRVASGHAVETTVSVVTLKSDELKGRIIGREGRNIRTLETLTGIDFIVDDTPGAVLLSGFDGVRREIARLTLERLLQDGRIHPARIEEAYHQSKSEIESHIVEVGEQAVFEVGMGSVHPELVKLLGRLRYRTSYGQNVLHHSIECARLASMLAEELGADPRVAARAALLHDIGKAVSHEIEGPHAIVGGRARAPLQGDRGRRARDGGPPQRGRAADRRGRDRADRRRALRRPARRPRRVARALRQAAARARGDRVAPRRRREGLRDARRPRDPRDRQARRRRRRRGGAAVAADRPRRGEGARVPGPDQGHGDPGEPGDRLRALSEQRALVFRGLDAWRAEYADVWLRDGRLVVRGVQIGVDPVPYEARYSLDTSPGYDTAHLSVNASGAGWSRHLDLRRDSAGAWDISVGMSGEAELPDAGGNAAAFDGARDCDLQSSPLTNAMPCCASACSRAARRSTS